MAVPTREQCVAAIAWLNALTPEERETHFDRSGDAAKGWTLEKWVRFGIGPVHYWTTNIEGTPE